MQTSTWMRHFTRIASFFAKHHHIYLAFNTIFIFLLVEYVIWVKLRYINSAQFEDELHIVHDKERMTKTKT